MVLPLLGLGFFCGPLLELSSSWKHQVPGGLITLMTVTIALGVLVFTFLEAFSYTDAIELCVITGKQQQQKKEKTSSQKTKQKCYSIVFFFPSLCVILIISHFNFLFIFLSF